MELSAKQIRSWQASTLRDRFTLWDGAIRSGKTIISLFAFLDWIGNHAPQGPIAIIGKTHTTIIRNILDVIGMIAPKGIGAYSMGSDRVHIMGRPVWIIGANDAQAESKVRGLTLAGAYVDEATLLPEAFFVQLLGRLSVPGASGTSPWTTTPASPPNTSPRRRKSSPASGTADSSKANGSARKAPSTTCGTPTSTSPHGTNSPA